MQYKPGEPLEKYTVPERHKSRQMMELNPSNSMTRESDERYCCRVHSKSLLL